MSDARTAVRERLLACGLGHHADDLLDRGLPSIRLRSRSSRDTTAEAQATYRTAAPVPGLPARAVAVASGGYHFLALLADGSVVAWGENDAGQLGDGTRSYRREPVPVAGVSGAVGISATGPISLALLEDGSVLGWGSNAHGAFEEGPDRLEAAPIAGLEHDVVDVWAGSPIVAALRDGTVLAVGPGAAESRSAAVPIRVTVPGQGLRPGGWSGRVAVLTDGTVAAWPGWTLGSASPHRLGRIADAVAVVGGTRNLVVLRDDGSVITSSWEEVPLDDSTPPTDGPAVVSGLERGVTALAAGPNCTFALMEDGSVWAWGWGYKGQLGDGSDSDHEVPIPVTGLEHGVTAIGDRVALKDDGSVWTWGGEVAATVDDDLAVGVGGRPDVPHGLPWPSYDGRLLSFVAQVNLADVSSFDEHGMLPAAGLLSFFYDLLQNPLGAVVSAVGF